MKRAIAILACLVALTLVSCQSSRPDPRLQGTWRSNKDETVAAWKHEGFLAPKLIERFDKDVLGKMFVTFSSRKVTSMIGDWKEVAEYRIVETGDDYVVYDVFSHVYDRDLRCRVRFVKDGYWISNDDIVKGYTEKYDRVNR